MKTITTVRKNNTDINGKKISAPPLPVHLGYIDGLRGLAIALVVIFHVFIGRVSSGVDIFLFLGGMFLLRAQMKNVQNPSGLTFFQSLIRLQRRIVPVLVVVVIIATLIALITYSPIDYKNLLHESAFSILYILNWRLIDQRQDYNAAGDGASIFQHLWSMSVQMQSYITIMIVVFIAWKVCSRFSYQKKYSAIMYSLVGIISILSFLYASYMMMSGNQSEDYYSTFSRFWEIGSGALLGIVLSRIVVSHKIRWALSIVGIWMILAVGIFMDAVKYFPAFPALIPIVGAVMVLISGQTHKGEEISLKNNGPIIVFLNSSFMSFVGKIAYTLYLWHWVILIFALQFFPEVEKSILGTVVIAISVVLAWGTHKIIEIPLRQKTKPPRGNVFSSEYVRSARLKSPSIVYPISAFLIIGLASIIVISPVIFNQSAIVRERVNYKKVENLGGYSYVYPGAEEFLSGKIPPNGAPMNPDIYNSMKDMLPTSSIDGCFTKSKSTNIIDKVLEETGCAYGDTESPREMYVVGGSHSEQYMEALDVIGKEKGIKIIPIIKMGCPLYQNQGFGGKPFPECLKWSRNVEDWIIENPPSDGVFMISTRPEKFYGWGPEIVPGYYKAVFNRIGRSGIPIYAVRDNPWLITPETGPFNPRRCIVDGGDNKTCGQPAVNNIDMRENPAISAYQDVPNVKNIDLSRAFIKDDWVYPVIGNVVVYRDQHHLTKQYVLTLTDELHRQMSNNPWTAPTEKGDVESLSLENAEKSFSDNIAISTVSSNSGMTRADILRRYAEESKMTNMKFRIR